MKQTVGDIIRTELTETQSVMGVVVTERQSVMAIPIEYDSQEHEPGDFKLTYDRSKPEEVTVARETFEKWKKKGYMAHRVTGKYAEKGDVLSEFDPDARAIIFSPPMQGGNINVQL